MSTDKRRNEEYNSSENVLLKCEHKLCKKKYPNGKPLNLSPWADKSTDTKIITQKRRTRRTNSPNRFIC